MARGLCACLFLLCVSLSAAAHVRSSLVCNQDCSSYPSRECRLSVCPRCDYSTLKCYESTTVDRAFLGNFGDRFCGDQGVMLQELDNGELTPYRCRAGGICTADSICLTSPVDLQGYCCARVPDDRRCQEVSLYSHGQLEEKAGQNEIGNPTRVVSMRLVEEYQGSTGCQRGVSYGYYNNIVFVDRGCRARFDVCHEGSGIGQLTTPFTPVASNCKQIVAYSSPGNVVRKPVYDELNRPARIVGVYVIQEFSRNICKYGETFRFIGSEIIVSNGCSARFRVCHAGAQTTLSPFTVGVINGQCSNPTCRSITLRSTNQVADYRPIQNPNYPVNIVSMTVLRDQSGNRCFQPSTYGYQRNTVYARSGCSALFQVCYCPLSGGPGPTAPLTTPSPAQGQACSRVNLFSRINRPAEKLITDSQGNIATVRTFVLLEQQPDSTVPCTRGDSFNLVGSTVSATKGCRGTFRVCYDDFGPFTAPPGQVCDRVNLFSRINRLAQKTVTDSNGQFVAIASMTLIEEQPDSVAPCTWIQTYSYSGSLAISRGGCRGIFWVCYFSNQAPFTAAPHAGPVCNEIRVTGQGNRQRQIRDDQNNPVQISSMDLVRKLSSYVCTYGHNYYYRSSTVFVTQRCQAVFRVCYEGRVAPTSGSVTEAPGPGQKCVGVNIYSRQNRPESRTITDNRGNQVTIESMTVSIQQSTIPCVRGVSFDFDGSVATASGGCRARFRVCYVDEGLLTQPPGEICDRYELFSRVNRPAVLSFTGDNGAPADVTSMTLIQEEPNSIVPCVEGRTYRYLGSEARSTDGCRGHFWICRSRQGPVTTVNPTGPICRPFVLSSTANNIARKQILDDHNSPVTIISMTLARQISARSCVAWVDYSFSRSFIEARYGCQARFKVCYQTAQPTAPAPFTSAPEDGQKCIRVLMFSRANHPQEQVITDSQGNPVTIRSMQLIRQHTKVPCLSGDSFSFLGSKARSQKGCRGTFRICFDDEEQLALTPAPGQSCEEVNLLSRVGSPAFITVTDSSGFPAVIQSMALIEQKPDSIIPCERGKSYSYDGTVARAKDGCRGAFQLCYAQIPGPPGLGVDCQYVALKGTDKETVKKEIKDSNGRPAQVISMELFKRASVIRCVQWQNYLFRGSEVVVAGGCFGIFKVCHEGSVVSTGPAQATGAPAPGQKCIISSLFSRQDRPASEVIRDDRGNAVIIKSMSLVFQYSNITCQSPGTFSFAGSVAAATSGCRGRFSICYDDESGVTSMPGQECKDEKLYSRINRKATVTLTDANGNEVLIKGMGLVRQEPDSVVPCVENQSFSFHGSKAESRDGCRGIFRLCYNREGQVTAGPNAPECKNIQLTSNRGGNDSRQITDDRGSAVQIVSVELVKRLSYVNCLEWYNYGHTDDELLVSNGCSAVFKVCYESLYSTTSAPLRSTPSIPGRACHRINLFSGLTDPAMEIVTDRLGNEVTILSMTLVLQHSQTACKSFINYGFSGSLASSYYGCMGTFNICYKDQLSVTESPIKKGCIKVKIASTLDKNQRVQIRDKKTKQPAVVLGVTVEQQVSSVACVLGRTFSFSGSRVTATKGCQAVFNVCYETA